MAEHLDMSEFEAQFNQEERYSPRMPNDDFERLAFLDERISDIDDVTKFREEDNDFVRQEILPINQILVIIRELEKLYLNKRRIFDERMARNDMAIRHDRTRRAELERERLRLLEEIAARERFLSQRTAIFGAVESKPWATGIDGKKALPHQWEGAHRLVSAERGILGDKPGLGKTLEMIMTIDMLRAQGKGQKVLIFTPKSVLPDFERAFKFWTDPTFVHVLNQTLKGIKVDLLEVIKHMHEAIVITNYEVWRKDPSILSKLKECCFDTVFLDESHVIKGWKSKTTQEIRELIYAENRCPKCGCASFGNRGISRICLSCEYAQESTGEFCSVKNAYFATGTPILNKPEDLFPPLNMIDRKAFPSLKDFLSDYCVKEYDYGSNKYVYTFGSGGSERLLKKLGMRYTARTRESAGVKMPPQEVKHHWLELDPEIYPKQAEFVKALRDRARLVFTEDAQLTQNAVLAWYTRMRQAASWPDAIKIKGCPHEPVCCNQEGEPDLKFCNDIRVIFPPEGTPPINESVIMDKAEEIVAEAVEEGDRIVVFSVFKPVIAELKKRCELRNLRVGVITGEVSESQRRIYIDDFNTNHTAIGEHQFDVLICQYATAQVGLNLNGAQQLLCIEREWNPGKEEQTLDRVRRLDSEFNSIVHILHCEGTATDLIDGIIGQKKSMLEGFEADVNLQEAMRKFLEG